ncbi:MAG TPA: TetR/AcrR family transcriptional regulator [Candidatus Eubacterium faecipullorum]|uniref:TetR/AcrR family transcriptional regulator n=1 Tax=Candidatus Eubacterium faecipullorum TaxID=2838571 RepID=A0A9D1RE22_9FIRM|nr:TetR/AcrR family transcriptional regulator [Candidatus Eubacterium faecipullorum]
MPGSHHKEAFDRISEKRQNEILEIAIEEFSSKGYNNANINIIAKNAGISIGLMYKYFATKEDLFLTCISRGMVILQETLETILKSPNKLLKKAELVIRATCELSREYKNYIKLYNEITAEKDGERAVAFAKEIESQTSRFYITAIAQALASGDVRQDLNPRLFAFFLDNLLLMLQFSFTCEYYKERLSLYTGVDIEKLDDDEIVTQLLKFIESAFTFSKD